VDETRDEVENARALAEQAKVEVGYSQVFAPVSGKVNVRAARQGEVVAAGRAHRHHHGPDPDLGLRAAAGDPGRRRATRRLAARGHAQRRNDQGKVINKSAEADFATQRDVSSRKRDIKTVQLKLLIDNPGERLFPA
jgi:HlyD family secretion protein